MIFRGKIEESILAERISLIKSPRVKYEAFLITAEADEIKEADLKQRIFKDLNGIEVSVSEINLSTVTDIPKWLIELKGFIGDSISGEGLHELADLMNNKHFQERRLNNEHTEVDKLREQRGLCIEKNQEKTKKRR